MEEEDSFVERDLERGMVRRISLLFGFKMVFVVGGPGLDSTSPQDRMWLPLPVLGGWSGKQK